MVEKLEEIRQIMKDYESANERVIRMEAKLGYQSPKFGVVPGHGRPRVDQINELERLYLEREKHHRIMIEARREGLEILEYVNMAREKRVLEGFYLNLRSWKEMAIEEGVSYTYMMRIRKKALEKLLVHIKT